MLGKHSSIQTGPREGAKFFVWLIHIYSSEQRRVRERGMEGAKSWLSPFSSLKRSLVLQSLGAVALVLHGADTVTPWVETVSGLY